jgi:Bacterial EndoU nuclease
MASQSSDATAGPPFAHFEASPEAIDTAGADIAAAAPATGSVSDAVWRKHGPARMGVAGDLSEPMDAAPRPTVANASQVAEAARFAGAVVKQFATAVTEFNSGVDGLNREWALAEGADDAADHGIFGLVGLVADPLVDGAKGRLAAHLRARRAELEADLDSAATDAAKMLNRGPNAADWQRLRAPSSSRSTPVTLAGFGLPFSMDLPDLPSFEDIRDGIGDGIRDMGEGLADGVRVMGDAVDTILDDGVGDWIDVTLSSLGDGLGEGLEALGLAGAGKSVREAMANAGDAVNRATDEAGDDVSDAADDAGDDIEDGADDAGDEVDPDEETGDEDTDQDGEDGDTDDQGEDDSDDEDADRNGHWEAANGDKPNPNDISASESRGHILYGDGDGQGGGHRHDSGVPNKTTFPEDWDDDKIIDEVEDVAKNPDEPPEYDEDDETWTVHGTRDGVDIEVIVSPDGKVKTGYPTGGEGVHRNDQNGDPQPLE